MQKRHTVQYIALSSLFWGYSASAESVEWSITIPPQTSPWYETLFTTLGERAEKLWAIASTRILESLHHYETIVSSKIEPLRAWYETNNIIVGIIPGLMTVHIIDFTLLVLGWFLLGWFLLKSII